MASAIEKGGEVYAKVYEAAGQFMNATAASAVAETAVEEYLDIVDPTRQVAEPSEPYVSSVRVANVEEIAEAVGRLGRSG